MQQQQVPPLRQLYSISDLPKKLVGSDQKRAEVDKTRRRLQDLLEVSPCGTKVLIRCQGFFVLVFESKWILVTPEIKYGDPDRLCLTYLEAHVPETDPYGTPLGILDDGKRRVYVSERDLENSHLQLGDIKSVAMEKTGNLLRFEQEDTRKRCMHDSYICLAVVRLGKSPIPRGEKPRSIVGAILIDRRPVVANITPEHPLSTKRVHDLLAAGETFHVGELLYMVLCRVEGLEEHQLRAKDMGVFLDTLDQYKDQLPVTACFRELMRELQPLYQPDTWGGADVNKCAAVLRRVLAPHAPVERLPEQDYYRKIVLKIFNEPLPSYNWLN